MTDSIKKIRPMLNERIKEIGNDTKTKTTGVSKKNKTIDPLESWKKLGIYRLSSVIHLLKRTGSISLQTEKNNKMCKMQGLK